MKLTASLFSVALLGLSMAAPASASPVFFKSPIGFAGTGCPAGSISVTGENTDTLSVLFDSYDAGSDAASGQGRRASCSFAVPIQVPQGYQVSTLTADWQGFAQGSAQLKRKYFFAGQPDAPWLTDYFNSRSGTDYLKRDTLVHSTTTWSECGRSVNLRINSNILSGGSGSYIAVDTVDLKNKVQFRMQWRKCS
ncbi:MAG: DUF4360 domain-containing protein [Thiolinea sp.]